MIDIAWTADDRALAQSEGWDVFDAGARGLEIQHLDEPQEEALASDAAAIEYVVFMAMSGSGPHAKALILCAAYGEVLVEDLRHVLALRDPPFGQG